MKRLIALPLYFTSTPLSLRAFLKTGLGSTITAMTATDDLVSLMSDLPSISTLEYYTTIGSTNDRARELAAQGTPEIALIAADEQVAGRGRLGRAWYTPPGTALAFSLLTRPKITAQR